MALYSNPSASTLKIVGQIIVELTFRTTPLYHNRDYLRSRYLEDGLSAHQLAKQIGCSHSVINDALDRFGITKGHRKSGRPEYGSRFARDGKRVPNKKQLKIIKRIDRCRNLGWSFNRITDALTSWGIKSPRGLPCWNPSAVRQVLNNNKMSC